MDCTDLVIGMARGNYSRIGDFYSRDRSTPQMDGFYGGRQDLTAALGYELDGQTVILFRRKLNVSDETDHSIGTEAMQVIWSRGQETGSYVHRPASGLEKDPVAISDFYRPDELKYHGKDADQRGVSLITFIEEKSAVKEASSASGGESNSSTTPTSATSAAAQCTADWKFPVSCDPAGSDCLYHARWQYIQRTDEIRFTITANYTDKWVAIGFSQSTSMPRTDVVLGWIDPNGRVFVGDMWAVGYTAPKLDNKQDVTNTSGSADDGKTILSFNRKRTTSDKDNDVAFSDEDCPYLLFPVHGGTYNAVNKKIGKHLQTPFISSDRICIKSCGLDLDADGNSYSTTPAAPKIYYSVGLKLVGLAKNFQVPNVGSEEFNNLAAKFGSSVENSLNGIRGFDEVVVTEFTEDGDGLVARMSVILDKSEKKDDVDDAGLKSTLKEAIASGRMGSISVDPSYLLFESQLDATASDPLETSDPKSWNSSLTSISLYSVIGCIIVLVVIAIIQASCTIYRVSRRKPTPAPPVGNKEQTAVNWRDYSSTNYAYEPFEVDELRAAAAAAAAAAAWSATAGLLKSGG